MVVRVAISYTVPSGSTAESVAGLFEDIGMTIA
jgi:uncharacterized membrane protein